MNYVQMERHFQILQTIKRMKQYIRDERNGSLKARSYDGMPKKNCFQGDQIGVSIVALEKLEGKLKKLEDLEAQERKDVEETIQALAGNSSILMELILTMHYLNGRDLEEVGAILQKKPDNLKAAIRKQFYNFEEAGDD